MAWTSPRKGRGHTPKYYGRDEELVITGKKGTPKKRKHGYKTASRQKAPLLKRNLTTMESLSESSEYEDESESEDDESGPKEGGLKRRHDTRVSSAREGGKRHNNENIDRGQQKSNRNVAAAKVHRSSRNFGVDDEENFDDSENERS